MSQPNADNVTVDFGTRWLRVVESPTLCLTFDDGPNPDVTPFLLALLERFQAKATFFVTGESLNEDSSKEILGVIAQQGHTVGNHGLIHCRGTCPRFDKMRDLIRRICGVDTLLVRSPYGSRSLLSRYFAENADALAFHWTKDFADWEPIDLLRVGQEIPGVVGPGKILLLHDGTVRSSRHSDRRQVLDLTELICNQAKASGIPVVGLASIFPHLHQRS